MLKKYTSFILLILFLIVPFSTFAQDDIIAEGTDRNGLIWKFTSDGTLEVSGTGEMSPNLTTSYPWKDYRPDIKKIVVKDGVKSIQKYAFIDCKKLTEVIIADSVKTIEIGAFSLCDNLESIKLSDGLEFLGAYVFNMCYSLKEITIPGTVEYIDVSAFYKCTSLEEVTVGHGVRNISSSAFSGCGSLKTITFTNSIEEIMSSAFDNCINLTDIYFGGTKEEFAKIKLSETNNNALQSATIHYFCIEHDFEELLIKDATCVIPAKYIKVCRNCKYKDGEEYEKGFASGHSGEWIITEEATKTQDGEMQRVCVVCAETETISYSYLTLGDVNGDGATDAKDATQILRYANGKSSAFDQMDEAKMFASADVNADKAVDAKDATQILRYVNGKTSVFDNK